MVCLGPRKKKTAEDRGVKKTSRLKPPSVTKPGVARTSVDSQLPKPSPRTSLLPNTTPTSRPTSMASTKAPVPKSRPSIASIRATAATAVKNTAAKATKSTPKKPTSPTPPTTKRYPISEMKEEVKGLKAKNEEHLKLIADQKAELELLKKQLGEHVEQETAHEALCLKEKEIEELKVKQQELALREREIEELRIQLEQMNTPAEALAEKQRRLDEKEAQLEEKVKQLDEKTPKLDQVASQLEELKNQNMEAVHQLADKEKELDELRSMIKNNPSVKGEEETALKKIEELNQQLEIQKKAHEDSLRLHEKALAEKNQLLKEQEAAIENLGGNHQEELRKLEISQKLKNKALLQKHQEDKLRLEAQLEEVRSNAEKNPAEDKINEHLEKMLYEFEQQEHTFAVQIQDLEQEHQSEMDHLKDNQHSQMSHLKKSHGQNRETWTERYLPTEAVSWPSPAQQPKLRPTPSLVESKSKTLLRVLGHLPEYQKPEPILTPLDPGKVQVYYSSVSAHATVKKNQEQMQHLLTSNGIPFTLVDVASSESARQYAKKANNNGSSEGRIKAFPQLFVGGDYRGQLDELVEAIRGEALQDILRPAKERQFTAQERAYLQKAEMNQERFPLPAALPTLKPVQKVQPLKEYDEDEELLRMVELELKEGKTLDFDTM
ncbi:hypothetical protein BY458DRAFT_588151 [Sporodiniella umbellata]|nr:hypothetical protein BY458DRAFT_588151 [Sporodiniella umbellata]